MKTIMLFRSWMLDESERELCEMLQNKQIKGNGKDWVEGKNNHNNIDCQYIKGRRVNVY